MFQIGAGATHAKRIGSDFCVDGQYAFAPHGSPTVYMHNMFRQVKFQPHESPYTIWSEPDTGGYAPIPLQDNIQLNGHFQHHAYLDRDTVRTFFDVSDMMVRFVSDILHEIRSSNSTAIHVRRGDYLKYPDKHPTCSLEYYMTALEEVGGDNVFVFSDDIPWCREVFSGGRYVSTGADWVDMMLMAECNNHILANSTYSWWAAYLSKGNGKTVIPSRWFGPAYANKDTSGLYLPGWISI